MILDFQLQFHNPDSERRTRGFSMNKLLGGLLAIIILLQTSANAADKIRIAYPTRGNIFVTLPLAQKKGFFREEGLEPGDYSGKGACRARRISKWRN